MGSNPGTEIVTKIIFPVADLAPATTFYRAMGFEVQAWDDTYALVRHRGEELLHLSVVDDFRPAANRAAGYLHVRDVDAWHTAWSALKDELGFAMDAVADRPWGMREFAMRDPDGNLLRIGQNL